MTGGEVDIWYTGPTTFVTHCWSPEVLRLGYLKVSELSKVLGHLKVLDYSMAIAFALEPTTLT